MIELLRRPEIATVVRRYAKFEDEIDAWMAPSRLRRCQPLLPQRQELS